MKQTTDLRGLIASIIQFLIALLGIWLIRWVINVLPMVRQLPEAAILAIDIIVRTFTILLIGWIGWEMRKQLPPLVPRFPAVGNIALSLAALVGLLIAYYTYFDVITPALGDLAWIYSALFLIAALGTLIVPVLLVFRNIGGLASTAATQVERARQRIGTLSPSISFRRTAGAERKVCPTCNTPYEEGDVFCRSCGGKLSVAEPAEAAEAAPANVCPNCGTPYEEGDRFCQSCGSRLVQEEPKRATGQDA